MVAQHILSAWVVNIQEEITPPEEGDIGDTEQEARDEGKDPNPGYFACLQ